MRQEVARLIVLSPLIVAGLYLSYCVWRFARASRRARKMRERRAALTPDRVMREVRASFDGLSYRHARGSRWNEPDPRTDYIPCQHYTVAGPRKGTLPWDRR